MTGPRWVSPDRAAALLGISRITLDSLDTVGLLQSYAETEGGGRRYLEEDVLRYRGLAGVQTAIDEVLR